MIKAKFKAPSLDDIQRAEVVETVSASRNQWKTFAIQLIERLNSLPKGHGVAMYIEDAHRACIYQAVSALGHKVNISKMKDDKRFIFTLVTGKERKTK